jgi:hypothetical protein
MLNADLIGIASMKIYENMRKCIIKNLATGFSENCTTMGPVSEWVFRFL